MTRDVTPDEVADLRVDPPRATLAVVVDGRTDLLPVAATAVDGGYQVDTAPRVGPGPDDPLDGARALLVLDDGLGWWELRAVTVRGSLRADGHGRYLLLPRRTVAWDYGRLRPVDDEAAAR